MASTPLYTTLDQIKALLLGKVEFTTDPTDENKMDEDLATSLICQAEGQLELDLSPRYLAPFQTDGGDAFENLPDRPTKQVLNLLAQLQAVRRVLETDFGRGSVVDGAKYCESVTKKYDTLAAQLLAKKKYGGSEAQGFAYPPLPGLKLNYMNNQADDGFHGQVLIASGSPSQGYAKGQINDPAVNFWNDFPGYWNW